MLTIFYSPQAPVTRVWNPILPQIDITELCVSHCVKGIYQPEPTLGFDRGTE